MKLRATLTLSLLLLASVTGKAENTLTVHGTLSDNGKPFPDGLVVLQRLKDEKCARLFATSNLTEKDMRKLESCTQDLPWIHTDAKGNYSYERLAPGWYNARFLWFMSEPRKDNQQFMCWGKDWIFSFHPEKDNTGKYNGYAQGRPFELREAKENNFDYQPTDYKTLMVRSWNMGTHMLIWVPETCALRSIFLKSNSLLKIRSCSMRCWRRSSCSRTKPAPQKQDTNEEACKLVMILEGSGYPI